MGEFSHEERKEEVELSSPFSAALAKLDGSLQTVHSQLDCLEAGLDVNDDRLIRSLIDARQQAARLRDLVRAQRPNAKWSDRDALRQLVYEIEQEIAAKARRNQQRRDKLAEVAGELEAGSIKHRFANRGTVLNNLRLEAIAELRAEAGQSEEVKELPGPPASDWLRWAVGLQESIDGAMLASLRKDFPKLERFAGEMEENYWVLGPQGPGSVAPRSQAAEIEVAPEASQSQIGVAKGKAVASAAASPPATTESYRTGNTADYDQSRSLPNSRRPNADSPAPSNGSVANPPAQAADTAEPMSDEALFAAIAAGPHVNCCDGCGGTFPATFKVCPFDNSTLRPIVQSAPEPPAKGKSSGSFMHKRSDVGSVLGLTIEPQLNSPQASARPSAGSGVAATIEKEGVEAEKAVQAELDRLKALLALQEPEAEVEPGLLDKIAAHKQHVIVYAGAIGAVLLVLVLIAAHSYLRAGAAKLRMSVSSARAHLTGNVIVPDSDIQRELGEKLAILKNGSLQATVASGIVTLAGQCPTQWQSVEAESIASQISGVKQVNNMVEVQPLDVNPPSPPTPPATKHPRPKTKK